MTSESETNTLTIIGEPMAQKTGKVEITNIPLNKIKLSRNSRTDVRDEELYGLMQSIKEVGLLQPIGVQRSGSGYEICYGNRRFLAVSKLDMKTIPAIIHENKRAHDMDIQNLSENVQRRNISLAEVGRYMELLAREGLSVREAAVRMGVSPTYVKSCQKAWSDVPERFKKDLEVRTPFDKGAAQSRGKISIKTVNAITSAKKTWNLDADQVNKLYQEAKTNDKFKPENIPAYAAAVKSGKKRPVEASPDLTQITCRFMVRTAEKERLTEKYVVNGPYKSLHGLILDMLRGVRNLKIDIVK